jgi:putative heme-binding domain-containing protein
MDYRLARRVIALSLLVCTASFAADAPKEDPFKAGVRTTDPLLPAEQLKTFHLPDGFEMQLVAAEPDLRKPMNMQWDALGRLWVTESREYPFPVELGQPARDTVTIFSDFDETGRARKVEKFAEGLNIPIGLYPFRSPNTAGKVTWKCLVWSIPNIWLMEDTDGDGKADRREVFLGPLGWQRDTHGNLASFRRGLDGRLYGTHGFNNESTFVGRDGSELKVQSGNTWRVRMDGTQIEAWTRGQVNPFGLTWDERGNLFSADCHSLPLYQLIRGGWYPSFGKPHDGLGFAPTTIQHSHGSTAIDAPMYVCDTAWPAEYQNHVFIGNVMTSRLNHDRIDWHGSSSKGTELPDFLTCDDPWFRPVDLSWGPDGALYVADFYNRIIGHYEVPLSHPGRDRERGRLWRIVYRGKKGGHKPSLALPEDIDGLVKELGSSNLTRRTVALGELTDRYGAKSTSALQAAFEKPASPLQQLTAMYGLHRLGSLQDAEYAAALTNSESLVRIHAARLGAERPATPDLLKQLRSALQDADAFVVRSAVQALAVHRDEANVAPLLRLLQKVPTEDDHLRHAVRIALRDQFASNDVLAAIDFTSVSNDRLPEILDLLAATHGPAAAERQLALLERAELSPPAISQQLPGLARRLTTDKQAKLIALARERLGSDVFGQADLIRGLLTAQAERGAKPDDELRTWAEQTTTTLISRLSQGDEKTLAKRVAVAAELTRALKLRDEVAKLAPYFTDARCDADARIALADTLAALDPQRTAAVFKFLNDVTKPSNERLKIVAALGKSPSPIVEDGFVELLKTAPAGTRGPIASALAGSPSGAEKLVEACAAGRVTATVLRDKGVEDRLKVHKSQELKQKAAALVAKLPPANAAIDGAIAERRTAFATAKTDAARGQELFAKHCSACHAVGGKGGNISPQLDGIGTRGVDRVIEDILDPNRNVDKAFRSTILVTEDGLVITGLVRRQDGKLLVLADNAGKEKTVDVDVIDSRVESDTSIMPTGFVEAMKPNDFFDLLAFLLSTKKAEGH